MFSVSNLCSRFASLTLSDSALQTCGQHVVRVSMWAGLAMLAHDSWTAGQPA